MWGRRLTLIVGILLLAACQPAVVQVEVTRLIGADAPAPASPAAVEVTRVVTETVTQEVEVPVTVMVTPAPLGTEERPFQLLFPPVANADVITRRAAPLADFLAEETGYAFTVGILDSEQAVVDLLCAAPAETIGMLSAAGYAMAHGQCGAATAAVGVNRDGQPWEAGMIVVRRDGGIDDVTDLAGARWAVPDTMSVSRFYYFQALLADAGVEVGEIVPVPGDNTAMLAVLNGEADFATGSYVPPILPFNEQTWTYGEDDPELWRLLGIPPTRSGIGFIVVNGTPENGGYHVRDARSGIFDSAPTVFEETEILTLSAPIPNETMAYGAQFPVSVARQITPLLQSFGAAEACQASLCAADWYNWTAVAAADEADYEPLRFIVETLAMSPVDLLPE